MDHRLKNVTVYIYIYIYTYSHESALPFSRTPLGAQYENTNIGRKQVLVIDIHS